MKAEPGLLIFCGAILVMVGVLAGHWLAIWVGVLVIGVVKLLETYHDA